MVYPSNSDRPHPQWLLVLISNNLNVIDRKAPEIPKGLWKVSFVEGAVRERLRSGVVGRDEHWDRPYVQGTGQPQVVSESSESAAQAALQGLTCEKKTESILVKAADLYSK